MDWFLNILLFGKTFLINIGRRIQQKTPRKTVIAVKNQNSPYVRLTVIMWGILGSGWRDDGDFSHCGVSTTWRLKTESIRQRAFGFVREFGFYSYCIELVSLSITFCHCDGKLAWSWFNVGFLLKLRGLSHKIGHHFLSAIFLWNSF